MQYHPFDVAEDTEDTGSEGTREQSSSADTESCLQQMYLLDMVGSIPDNL
jgi:hypothetical protein